MKNEDIKLPDGINETDLKWPSWESTKDNEENRVVDNFELWFTQGFGWCIPTLLISKASRRSSMSNRTYAVTLDNQPVRIGKGPHILRTVTVYVKSRRKNDLQKFLDLKESGSQTAGNIRDRISTRRAQTALRRGSLFAAWDE